MKKVTYLCDRCGKEVENPEELQTIYTYPNYSKYDNPGKENIMDGMDFCQECVDDIRNFAMKKPLTAVLEESEPAKPKGKPGRKKIDKELVWRLYMQGVKVPDIAEQCNMKVSSVHTLLSKMRKERLDENGKIKEEYREDEDEGSGEFPETV